MGDMRVFLSGGAGGLGGATARYLAGQGARVFVGDLEGERLEAIGEVPRVTAIPLDVTDEASVEAAAETVARQVDGLEGLVPFAGVLTVGSLIELDDRALRRIVEVNLLGAIRVNRVFFPLVLRRRGRIVVISSETGWQTAMPFNGPYAMTKHALELYADTARRELAPLGVRVVKVQPGPFRTAMVGGIEAEFARAAEASRHFGGLLRKLGPFAASEGSRAGDPELVARAVHRALTARRPRAAYSVRPDLGRSALTLLPEPVTDGILKLALR